VPCPRLPRSLAGLLLCCAVLPGCGLADYEARMAEAQERVKRFERENSLLDEPLDIPTHKVTVKSPDGQTFEDQVPVARVFLRPPRGISKTAKNKDKAPGALFYQYPSRDAEPNAAAPDPNATPADPNASRPAGVTDVFLAFADAKDAREAEAFGLALARKLPGERTTNEPTVGKRDIQPPGRKDMTFKKVLLAIDEKGPASYAIYVHQAGGKATAVAYKIKGPPDGADEAIRLSLESLGVGDDELPLRVAWNKRGAGRPPAPR
jgi:hypothetical protein